MKSRLIKLADLDNMKIDEGYLNNTPTEEDIIEKLSTIAKASTFDSEADCAAEGATVHCTDENGKTVLVYPGLGLSAALDAEKNAMGKKAGDNFTAVIGGKEKTLTVKKVTVCTMPEINDELAKMNSFNSLEEMKADVITSLTDNNKKQHLLDLTQEMINYITSNSEYELDEAEMNEMSLKSATDSYNFDVAMGMYPETDENGNPFDGSEIINSRLDMCRESILSHIAAAYIAKEDNYEIDMEKAKEESEMFGYSLEEYIDGEYYNYTYMKIQQKAMEVLG